MENFIQLLAMLRERDANRRRASRATSRAAERYESDSELSGVEGGRATANETANERAERRGPTGAEGPDVPSERRDGQQIQMLATGSGVNSGSRAGG